MNSSACRGRSRHDRSEDSRRERASPPISMSSRRGRRFSRCSRSSASKGRMSGAWFICGHLVGDVTWGALAVAAIIGANQLGATLFEAARLRLRALSRLSRRARGDDAQGRAAAHDRREPPARDRPRLRPHQSQGLSGRAGDVLGDRRALCRTSFSMADAPQLLAAAFVGFLAADATLIFAAGLPAVRRFFLAHGVDRDARRRRDVHRLRRQIAVRRGERGDAAGVSRGHGKWGGGEGRRRPGNGVAIGEPRRRLLRREQRVNEGVDDDRHRDHDEDAQHDQQSQDPLGQFAARVAGASSRRPVGRVRAR